MNDLLFGAALHQRPDAPGLVIDDKLISSGKVLTTQEIGRLL